MENATLDTDSQKNDPLEMLSKEELVKKCKHVLMIAQKAKQAKDSMNDEIQQMSNKLLQSENNFKLYITDSKIMLDEMLKQKNVWESNCQVLKNEKSGLESELHNCRQELASLKIIVQQVDTENKSHERQVKRLTDENDQLINHLDVLEKQIHELHKIGEQQREQLLLLEEKALPITHSQNEWPDGFMVQVLDKIQDIKDVTNTLNLEMSAKDETIQSLQNGIKEASNLLESTNNKLKCAQQELDDTKKKNTILYSDLNNYHVKLKKVYGEVKELKNSKFHLLVIIKEYSGYINDWQNKMIQANKRFNDESLELGNKYEELAKIRDDMLVKDENSLEMQKKINELQLVIEKEQKNALSYKSNAEELQNQLTISKREHFELLKEMNDMNQALKERGETISKQQEYVQELLRQLQNYEQEAILNRQQKEKLEEQLVHVKHENDEKETSGIGNESLNLSEVETASTSTVSRFDESSRMRDLEGSWEERYTKLRTLALKLKAKVKELTEQFSQEHVDKIELQNKVSIAVHNLQTVQAENDILQDKIEALKKENVFDDNKLQYQEFGKVQSELELCKKERDALLIQLQSLKKDLEAETDSRKQAKNKISKFEVDIKSKEKDLALEVKKHKETKDKLDISNKECKNKSVLSLEMEVYERSLKEKVQQLEKANESINELKIKLEDKEKSMAFLEDQQKLQEGKMNEKEKQLREMETSWHETQYKLSEVEAVISQKENRIHEIIRSLEETRMLNEETNSQLALTISQNQKTFEQMRAEKEKLMAQVLGLEDKVRELNTNLHDRKQELSYINNEFSNYKVRAQSVLRQNQTRDVGIEEKLNEEINSLQAQVNSLTIELENINSQLTITINTKTSLGKEKNLLLRQLEEAEKLFKKEREDNKKLFDGQQQILSEHRETLRAHKLHTDTLAQCYKQQLVEQEERHMKELVDLRTQNQTNISSKAHDDILDLASMQREEGEGSESIESSTNVTKNQPVPLDKLLGMDIDGSCFTDYEPELLAYRKQIMEYEARVNHLMELLADAEQDLAKHAQLNQLLKEEIRRHQRSVEREQHAENLEYLKNVILKFLTLTNGDERSHLVPVLNTILKLSPDEVTKLNFIAKGGDNTRGWGSYLPPWYGNQQ